MNKISIWSSYESRLKAHGMNKYDASRFREERFIDRKLPDSLSHHSIIIYPAEHCYNLDSEDALEYAVEQNVAIINSDNLNEKTLITFPGEDIDLGSLIFWKDNYWIVSERDANTTVYTRAKLLQCNHLLKWIMDGTIYEQWCVINDGTKYMAGETEDRDYVTTKPDTRMSVQISKNPLTVRFDRQSRFLIDDEDTLHKMAYQLTKPMKRGYTYNGKGTFVLLVSETTATDYDNHELGIADYYRYFQKPTVLPPPEDAPEPEDQERKVWI